MLIKLAGMGGVAPKITPELLPDNLAQTATNVILHNGGVSSLSDTVWVQTPTKAGAANTIYRFGRNHTEDGYWFKFSSVVNIVKGPIPGDTEERTYYTGDGAPKKTNFSLATGSGSSYPVVSYEMKIPSPASAPTVTQVETAGPEVEEQRAYIYTYVTGWGEESGPSLATVGTADATHLLDISGFATPPTGAYNITHINVYRSVTSSSGTNYYFTRQITVGTASFTDDTAIASMGEPIPTLDWDEPPDDLFGLVALPSGALCGISGKDICFSVINAPYAWPEKYRLTCDYNPVAVAPMGQGVVVVTDGLPYMINSGDPESTMMVRLDDEQACVAARSVVPFGGGVVYASPDGLISITQGGIKNLTENIYDHKAWQAINPSSIFAVKHDNRYYGFTSSGGFVLDTSGNFTTHNITATAAYVDPVLDRLYVAIGAYVKKWDSGSALTHTWKSKRYNLPKQESFACAQVLASSFSNLTFRMYADGVLKHTQTVTSDAPFRLPSGFKGRRYEFEISGTDHWTHCAIAQSMEELKNV